MRHPPGRPAPPPRTLPPTARNLTTRPHPYPGTQQVSLPARAQEHQVTPKPGDTIIRPCPYPGNTPSVCALNLGTLPPGSAPSPLQDPDPEPHSSVLSSSAPRLDLHSLTLTCSRSRDKPKTGSSRFYDASPSAEHQFEARRCHSQLDPAASPSTPRSPLM